MIFATATGAGGTFSLILMMVAMFAIMYFMMIRPQRKEEKRTQEMLAALEIGDAVVTHSGFYGIIIDISEEDVIVEFGNNKNCRIPMRKSAIAQVEKAVSAQAVPAVKTEEKKVEEKAGDSSDN